MLNNLIEGKSLIGMSKDEVIRHLDTTDIKQFKYEDDLWMYLFSKPGWIPATNSPVEVVDIIFKKNKVVSVTKRE